MRSLYVGALLAAQLGCRWGFGAALGDDEPADARNGDVPIDVPPGTITTFEVAPPAFSTSSTAFVDIPGGTFEIPPSPGTTWLLVTAATLAQPTLTAFGAEARYLVSGVEQGMGGTQGMGAGPWQHFYVFPGMDVPQTVAYQLRDTGGQMASIDHLRIVAMPLPANTEPHYASMDAVQNVSQQMQSPALLQLPLGAMSGDYVVMVLVNSSDAPGLSNIYVEFLGPAGELLLPNVHNPREPWQSVLMAKIVNVTSPNATVTLRTYTGSVEMGQVRYMRAFAMRLDAFASSDHVLTTTTISTTSSGVSTGPVLAPTGNAARYWYLASAWSGETCGNMSIPTRRRMHFTIEAGERLFEHTPGNCALDLTYGTTGVLSSKPDELTIGVSSPDGFEVRMRDSQILLLGLP